MTLKKKISFMTLGDSNYFQFMETNIQNISILYPKAKIFICDFGLDKSQISKLEKLKNAKIIPCERKEELKKYFYTKKGAFFENLFKLKENNKYLRILLNRLFPNEGIYKKVFRHILISKQTAILKVITELDNDYLVLLDGDAVLFDKIDNVFEKNFDVGVTTKASLIPQRKIYNGFGRPINAGVIFFKCNDKRKIVFISEWLSKMLIDLRNNPNAPYPEQDSLEKIAYSFYPNKEKFKIVQFPGDLYNWTKPERGVDGRKIIHYKGVGSRKEKSLYLDHLNLSKNR